MGDRKSVYWRFLGRQSAGIQLGSAGRFFQVSAPFRRRGVVVKNTKNMAPPLSSESATDVYEVDVNPPWTLQLLQFYASLRAFVLAVHIQRWLLRYAPRGFNDAEPFLSGRCSAAAQMVRGMFTFRGAGRLGFARCKLWNFAGFLGLQCR